MKWTNRQVKADALRAAELYHARVDRGMTPIQATKSVIRKLYPSAVRPLSILHEGVR